LKDELKGKAKIEEITEGKENDKSAEKLGMLLYFDSKLKCSCFLCLVAHCEGGRVNIS